MRVSVGLREEVLLDFSVSDVAMGAGLGSSTTGKAIPCPFSRAKIAKIRSTGTITSLATPENRALNDKKSWSIFKSVVASQLMLRTISPS